MPQNVCYSDRVSVLLVCVCVDDQLVSGSSDGSVRVWSMDSLKCIRSLEGHTADVNCVVAQVTQLRYLTL